MTRSRSGMGSGMWKLSLGKRPLRRAGDKDGWRLGREGHSRGPYGNSYGNSYGFCLDLIGGTLSNPNSVKLMQGRRANGLAEGWHCGVGRGDKGASRLEVHGRIYKDNKSAHPLHTTDPATIHLTNPYFHSVFSLSNSIPDIYFFFFLFSFFFFLFL